MSFTWSKLVASYTYTIHTNADPRTEEWPLVKSPWNPVLVTGCYLYFCLNARHLTSKMPAYKLRPCIMLYNATMVALSAYMTYEFFMSAYLSGYSVLCEPVDFSSNPLAVRVASICWLYYISKYIELAETGLFALRKKYNQISVLHVYHHTSMIWVWWLALKFAAGGQAYIFGGINSFVHTVMYSYYGLSAIGPWMQKYLWWKKYITMLQLSQFVILFFFCIRSVAIECGYCPGICYLMVGYSVTLLVLFLNFYIKAYSGKKKSNGKHEVNGVQNEIKKYN